jgi:hypothetical protein
MINYWFTSFTPKMFFVASWIFEPTSTQITGNVHVGQVHGGQVSLDGLFPIRLVSTQCTNAHLDAINVFRANTIVQTHQGLFKVWSWSSNDS